MKFLLVTLALVGAAFVQLANGNVCAGNPSGSHMNIRNPRDCSRFTMCLGATAHPMECAAGMHFSLDINDCDLEHRANCQPDESEETDPEGPVDPNNPCSRNVNFELIASADSCSEYIVCACGHPNRQRCADGLVFDARTQVCNVPARAQCVGAVAARPVCPRQPGNVAHPHDCKHFFLCLGQGSQALLRLCQPGLHFNRPTSQCDRVACSVPAPTNFAQMVFAAPQLAAARIVESEEEDQQLLSGEE